MIIKDDFMEKLREEYEGLNLTDSQILSVKGVGINKEQMALLITNWKQIMFDFDDMLRNVVRLMNPVIKNLSMALSKINEYQVEFIVKPIKNKKGKKLKCWENKRFYQ